MYNLNNTADLGEKKHDTVAKFFADGALILTFASLSPWAAFKLVSRFNIRTFSSTNIMPYPAPILLHSSFSISKHFDKPDLKTNEALPWRRSRPQSPLVEHIFWSLINSRVSVQRVVPYGIATRYIPNPIPWPTYNPRSQTGFYGEIQAGRIL
ncbi:hypothetical protein EDD22DRAFT_853415 [Suillus occidentalis]|nr:hypothetical protein EDD22DRAFT_853415 [Suillus occidentalis]